ncbi:MAG: PAS domain-containing sensor histidine kinase [Candidatus Eremiobacteraeota bacterium]|nr:PAS domain-containing sensor histidine kinase [Candidatus Eremiobacteraeota bacterium]
MKRPGVMRRPEYHARSHQNSRLSALKGISGHNESEHKYRNLFDNAPISLWEEDFSQVKAVMEAIRRTGVNDFRTYFDTHPEMVLELASLVRIMDVNLKTLELYRARSKREFQKNLNTFFCLESFDEVKEELVAIAEGRTEFEKESVNQNIDGEKLYIYLRWSAVPGYEGSLARVIICIMDITAQKLADERLAGTRNEFLSILSHDLKSPLASILAYTYLIGKIAKDVPDVSRNVAIVKDIGHFMLNIINNVVEADQIESDSVIYSFEDIPLSMLFRELSETFEGLASLKKITITWKCDNGTMVHIDSTRITRVFHNLIINALHHTLEGGRIEIEAATQGERVGLKVSDTGRGMSPEIKGRVFEKFAAGQKGQKGTGLGLYIVKKFLEGHGSSIDLESTPGKGTTFRFTLPLGASPGF